MRRSCKIAIGAYLVLGVAALGYVAASNAGLFGLSPDPRSGLAAVLLATPWFWIFDTMLKGQVAGLGLFMAAAGIGLNAGILGLLCEKFGFTDGN